jgi:hypothetical protein
MLGVASPGDLNESKWLSDGLICTIAFDNKIEVMRIAVLVLPCYLATSTSWTIATLIIKIQSMLLAKPFELRPDDGLQQAADDLSELVRR